MNKCRLISEAVLSVGFLYFLHAALQTTLQLHIKEAPGLWVQSIWLLLAKHTLYALIYLGGGWFFFYKLLPPQAIELLPASKTKQVDKNPVFKRLSAFLWGTGAALFLLLFIITFTYIGQNFFSADFSKKPTSLLRPLLQNDIQILLLHIFFSGIITAISEELFYRHCLQYYLSKYCGVRTAITLSCIIFTLVHLNSPVWFVMLVPAFTFSFLYWKQGLSAAIMAHTVYNTGILILSKYGF